MTLREALGGDVQRIHDQVDALLDQEDGVLALFDGRRVVTYARGFGVSASQLEFVGVEIERALRSGIGRTARDTTRRRNREGHQGNLSADDVGGSRRRPADHLLRLARKIA